jgi:hypothetical protein
MRPRIRGEAEKALDNIRTSGTFYIRSPVLAPKKQIALRKGKKINLTCYEYNILE